MTARKKSGFTLIELLIVIAILGVLAVVVLVAINPVQQLARTRDAGRISTVQQLGRAVEAYYTSQGTYPTNAEFTNSNNTNVLVTSGEITRLPALIPYSVAGVTACESGADADGWCYDADTDSFALYSTLEANVNRTVGSCTGTAYTAYLSLAGRSCIVCTTPTADTDATSCQ